MEPGTWDVTADTTAADRLVAAQAAGRLVAAQAADRLVAGRWTAALAAGRWTAASVAAWGPRCWATDERTNGAITVIITVGFPIT